MAKRGDMAHGPGVTWIVIDVAHKGVGADVVIDVVSDDGPTYATTVSAVEWEEMVEQSKTWTYEGYWNIVLGPYRSAAQVIREFDLLSASERKVDEWLGIAESEAWAMGGLDGNMKTVWAPFHAQTLVKLLEAQGAQGEVVTETGKQ
jgi:hypothetical protein